MDSERLAAAIEAVADGRPVDWKALEAEARDESDRRRLHQLRIVAAVASVPETAEDERSLADTHVGSLPPPTGERPPLARQWGHLELFEKVSEGSFGEVYRARDPRLDRVVALKLLRTPSTPPELADKLLKEGKLLAKVRHPNVVTVHGAGIYDQRVGLWMEFVQGTTLEAMLQTHGPFGASEAALIGQELCRAVAAVHAADLVHGDIKANNVMREQGGRLVLMDFGAGHVLSATRLGGGELTGTPFYVAPEVLFGGPVSVASDVYALAVLLYHLVTGDYPLRAGTLDELRRAHVEGRLKTLHDARPDLPESFIRVVDRGLDAEPGRRYASAGSMKTALGASLGVETSLNVDRLLPERAEATPPARPPVRPLRGWPRAGLVAAGLLLALLAGWQVLPRFAGEGAAVVRAEPLAVLPFENLTGDSAWEHVAEGVSEDVAVVGQFDPGRRLTAGRRHA